MLLLLMRHGDAVVDSDLGDGARWLTGKGRTVTRNVGAWLRGATAGPPPAEVWTSPLVRAVQTAEIVVETLGITDQVSVCGALSTSGDPRDALHRAARHARDALLLVGHEPSLSSIAQSLLGSHAAWPGFKKSGVLAVEWSGRGHAKLVYALRPKDLHIVTCADDLPRL